MLATKRYKELPQEEMGFHASFNSYFRRHCSLSKAIWLLIKVII
jgi:hypothetical protein